jgi:hypothetical protein
LVHGHFDERSPGVWADDYKAADDKVNTGVAIVCPSEFIMETLNRKELVDDEAKQEAEHREQMLPTMDDAAEEPGEEGSFTKDDFVNALKKASKKLDD